MFRWWTSLQGWFLNPRMALWRSNVERIIGSPPGSDDGCSPKEIVGCAKLDFSLFSTWTIVCQEVLDTNHPTAYYERTRDELRQRGISDETFHEMRRVAWLTAGWLNFEMMLWDWCHLDERDMRRAIDWQFRDGWITRAERDDLIDFVKMYEWEPSRIDQIFQSPTATNE